MRWGLKFFQINTHKQAGWLLGRNLFLKATKYGQNNVIIVLWNVKLQNFPGKWVKFFLLAYQAVSLSRLKVDFVSTAVFTSAIAINEAQV